MIDKKSMRELQTLTEHQEILNQVLAKTQDRVLIVSPYISISAIEADNIAALVGQAVARGVRVQVFIDSERNCYSDGTMKNHAIKGIAALVEAGAKVGVVNGINSKILAQDNDLITVGSFNWLSALLIRSGEQQLEEMTKVYSGEMVPQMIAQELDAIRTAGYEFVTQYNEGTIEVTKTGKVFGLCFMLAVPLIIGSEIGNISAGFVCTALLAAIMLAVSYWKRNHFSSETVVQHI